MHKNDKKIVWHGDEKLGWCLGAAKWNIRPPGRDATLGLHRHGGGELEGGELEFQDDEGHFGAWSNEWMSRESFREFQTGQANLG
jgi:hypothetical protein